MPRADLGTLASGRSERFAQREAIIDIGQAQDELRAAGQGGAPGVFVSGLAWLAADAAWYVAGPLYAFAALFVGGMLIFPSSFAIARAFRAPKPTKGNPLNALGFEVTVPLFAGLLIAFALLPFSETFGFAALAVVVGARYFAFATLYRERLYWLLGALLFAIGTGFAIKDGALPFHITLAVGATELVFAAWLFTRWNTARG